MMRVLLIAAIVVLFGASRATAEEVCRAAAIEVIRYAHNVAPDIEILMKGYSYIDERTFVALINPDTEKVLIFDFVDDCGRGEIIVTRQQFAPVTPRETNTPVEAVPTSVSGAPSFHLDPDGQPGTVWAHEDRVGNIERIHKRSMKSSVGLRRGSISNVELSDNGER